MSPYNTIRWLRRKDGGEWDDDAVQLPSGTILARDEEDRAVILMSDAWTERFFATRNEGIDISEAPFEV